MTLARLSASRRIRGGLAAVALLLPAPYATAQPAYLGLDDAGHLAYFGESGELIQRTRLRTSVPIGDFLDLEVLDFLPEAPGPEVVLLRREWWIDVMPLPAPRQDAVARLRLLRFTPRSGHEPRSLALGGAGGPPDLHLHVASRATGSAPIAWVDRFPLAPVGEGRGHDRVGDRRWTAEGGWTELAPGLLASGPTWVGFGPDGLESVEIGPDGEPTGRRRIAFAPRNPSAPVRLRLVRDRLHLLEDGTVLHRWTFAAGEWRSDGPALRLRSPAPLLGLVPLRR